MNKNRNSKRNYAIRGLFVVMVVTAIIAALVIISRRIGSQTVSPNAWLFEAGNCDQPCWHGIQLGKTSLDQVETLLHADSSGYISEVTRSTDLHWISIKGQLPSGIVFSVDIGSLQGEETADSISVHIENEWPAGVSIVDALLAFGTPDSFQLCGGNVAQTLGPTFYIGQHLITVRSDDWDTFLLSDLMKTSALPARIRTITYLQSNVNSDQHPRNWIGFVHAQSGQYKENCFG